MNARKKHAVALIDGRSDKSMIRSLEAYADKVLLLPRFPALSEPVCAHADMLVWCCGKTVFTYSDYLTLAPEIFSTLEKLGYEINTVLKNPSPEYPHDVTLNCAVVGKSIIANAKYYAPEIKAFADKNGLTLLHTNQGYSKCSTVVISENAIITSDASIAAVAKLGGIDTLTVNAGYVSLPPYEYGFIGGASGADTENVYFCGSLDNHPDADKIRAFCQKHNKQVVCLSQGTPEDVGTVMFFD